MNNPPGKYPESLSEFNKYTKIYEFLVDTWEWKEYYMHIRTDKNRDYSIRSAYI